MVFIKLKQVFFSTWHFGGSASG